MDNLNKQRCEKLDLDNLNNLCIRDNIILKEMVDAIRQEKDELVHEIIVLKSVLSVVQKKTQK